MPPSPRAPDVSLRSHGGLLLGVFLLVAAVYALSGPGRIDIIDGQHRFEVARSLLEVHQPTLRDPALQPFGAEGRGAAIYARYSPGASIAALPLVWLGGLVDDGGERARFLFSLTSGLFGALAAALLAGFFLRLGVAPARAAGWAIVSALATLVWPTACSTFDQAQHGCLLLVALFLAHESARRGSVGYAVAGGLAGAALLNYQEVYALLLPAVALAALAPPGAPSSLERRAGARRYAAFGAAAAIGLVGWAAYNSWRFGAPLATGKLLVSDGTAPPTFGNPAVGLVGLLLSPGKSVILYSPVVVLAVWGLPELARRFSRLGLAIAVTAAVHLLLISSLAFYGGDWAWGPRYLVTTLPMLALGLPFLPGTRGATRLAAALVALGVVVQLLALSVDHQRFFFERRLPDHFWAEEPLGYLRPDRSALFARPGEIAELLEIGVPAEIRAFLPAPYRGSLTYAPFGTPPGLRSQSREWMRAFIVFWVPRPWPLWLSDVPPEHRPVPLPELVLALVALGGLGLGLVVRGLRAPAGDPAAATAPVS